MAQKNVLFPSKLQSIVHNFNENNQYSNFNLNQSHKCLNSSLVQSNSKSTNNNNDLDSKIVDVEKRSLRSCNKSLSNNAHLNPIKCFTASDEPEENAETKKWKMDSSNATFTKSSSTLSLHIAAYENSFEGDTVSLDEGLEKNKCSLNLIKKQKQILINSTLNPFEFPRQQTDEKTVPDVMQFTASQQLLNPNQMGSSNSNQQGTQNAAGVHPVMAHLNQRPPPPPVKNFGTAAKMSVENEYLLRGEDVSALVFDIHSNAFHGGYGGLYTSPQCSMSPYVGIRPEDDVNLKKQYIDDQEVYIPHEGTELKKYIEKSKITDWDLFEDVFEYLCKDKLQFDPTLSPLLFIEGNVYDRKHREKLAEIMFEKFNSRALCVMPIAPLIIFRREPTYNGVVVDVGTDETTVSCISDGFLLRKNVSSVEFGLDTVADLCGEMLNKKKINFASNLQNKYSFAVHSSYEEVAQRKFLGEFAQKVLYCQKKPFKDSLLPANNVDYTFGSKKYSFDAKEQCKILECLFDPSVTPSNVENFNGLYKLIEDTVDKANIDSIANFYSHIYTNGEGTLFKGFTDRLNHELTKTPPRLQARLNSNVKGYEKNCAWKQGGILAGMGTTGQLWVSKMEFEDGASKKLHYF